MTEANQNDPIHIAESAHHYEGVTGQDQPLPDEFAQERAEVRRRSDQAAYDDLVAESRALIVEEHSLNRDVPEHRVRLAEIAKRQKEIGLDLGDFPDAVHPD